MAPTTHQGQKWDHSHPTPSENEMVFNAKVQNKIRKNIFILLPEEVSSSSFSDKCPWHWLRYILVWIISFRKQIILKTPVLKILILSERGKFGWKVWSLSVGIKKNDVISWCAGSELGFTRNTVKKWDTLIRPSLRWHYLILFGINHLTCLCWVQIPRKYRWMQLWA